MEQKNLPNDIDTEKALLAALLVRNGEIIPTVATIISENDFYRPEHQIIFRVILQLYTQEIPPNIFSIFEELRKTDDAEKIDFAYLRSIAELSYTNAYAVANADTIKKKSNLRCLIQSAENLSEVARKETMSPDEIIAEHQIALDAIQRSTIPAQKISFAHFFAEKFKTNVAETKAYANRSTGFYNIDEHQFFLPGLYVIGATPAAGKTTFCWQMLEQLATEGETCIYCSYEMSQLELFVKSLARELFKRNDDTALTAAQIRKGGNSTALERLVVDFADSQRNLSVMELQDETVDDLLRLLKPFCTDKSKAPVVCLDYLQIIPTNRESTKIGIDETVRKLKKFQRDTNTTFIVISAFNRMNYSQMVSFESFKESGNIEYTADVVWALQLDIMNQIQSGDPISESRRKIEEAKRQQPRQIHLKCLKNRQGTNYDCLFNYHSAHDLFEPCEKWGEIGTANLTVKK